MAGLLAVRTQAPAGAAERGPAPDAPGDDGDRAQPRFRQHRDPGGVAVHHPAVAYLAVFVEFRHIEAQAETVAVAGRVHRRDAVGDLGSQMIRPHQLDRLAADRQLNYYRAAIDEALALRDGMAG